MQQQQKMEHQVWKVGNMEEKVTGGSCGKIYIKKFVIYVNNRRSREERRKEER